MNLALTIRSYDTAAQFDHYEDGSFQAFDVIDAEVTAGALVGQHLRILIESGSSEVASWNRPGEMLQASVEADSLEAGIVFAGAFTLLTDRKAG